MSTRRGGTPIHTAHPKSITAIIRVWPTIDSFALALRVKRTTAQKMCDRDSMSPVHWPRLIYICKDKGVPGVTMEWLTRYRQRAAKAVQDRAKKSVIKKGHHGYARNEDDPRSYYDFG